MSDPVKYNNMTEGALQRNLASRPHACVCKPAEVHEHASANAELRIISFTLATRQSILPGAGFPRNELARRSICGKEPPLVVHNMKDPKDMHYIGDMYRNCSTNTA